MDDDFDLPDEGTEGRSASFVSDLFGGAKRPAPSAATGSNRSALDDILAGAPRRRQPVVTFQDEKEEAATEAAAAAPSRAPSASLLDSLFSSSASGGEQRRKAATVAGGGRANAPSPTPPATRQSSQTAAANNRVLSQQSPVAAGSAPPPDAAPSSASVSLLQAETDQLRREVSNLRFEHSEDQKTIGELRRRLDAALEDHQRTTERLTEKHKTDISELERKHERALEEAKREGDKGAQILSNIREQEGSFANLATRVDALNFILGQLRESVQSVGGRGDAMEANLSTFTADLRTTLDAQHSDQWKRLETDRQQSDKK
ncbi:hypothetical protein niasHT_004042 [Heterodera trifolii]|uniref:Uncharacterized protein n=1 Tax=Heterodera trifolii TaxID=157864 RepID=A0ABD2LY04_9BILA